jgi:hypothetical protein
MTEKKQKIFCIFFLAARLFPLLRPSPIDEKKVEGIGEIEAAQPSRRRGVFFFPFSLKNNSRERDIVEVEREIVIFGSFVSLQH